MVIIKKYSVQDKIEISWIFYSKFNRFWSAYDNSGRHKLYSCTIIWNWWYSLNVVAHGLELYLFTVSFYVHWLARSVKKSVRAFISIENNKIVHIIRGLSVN